MPTQLRYIGTTNPLFETAITGKPSMWRPGRTSDVPDADVAALLASGLFEVVAGPAPFSSRALNDGDDGDTLICATAQTATVNTGLKSNFGCAFKGAISFNGTASVTDVRTTGAANPWCALVQIGTDAYDVVGGKA